jgi:hypothetical protein
MEVVARASESQHWYTKDGKPQYTVKAKNGQPRNTTLRDARTMGLVPSVTTIMGSAAKPGLEAWKLNQMMLACMTLPRIENEPEEAFIQRVVRDSKEHAKMAAERGTDIHAALESWYGGIMVPDKVEYQAGVAEAVKAHFGECKWSPEKSFGHPLGFGGKIDLHTRDGEGVVIDFKTKEFTSEEADKLVGSDENVMQLSAYRVGLELPKARCANVFVSVTEPGLVKIVEWQPNEIERGWAMFDALRQFWYAKSGLEL